VHAGESEGPLRRGLLDQGVLAVETAAELRALARTEKRGGGTMRPLSVFKAQAVVVIAVGAVLGFALSFANRTLRLLSPMICPVVVIARRQADSPWAQATG
jgi:hypothetical protein